MTAEMPLPESPEEISAEWLSSVLEARGEAQRARSVEQLDAHSGTTGRARIRVQWERPGLLPDSIFVKLRPSDPVSQAMVLETGMGRREASFYARLAREVPVRIPKPYFADWSEDGASYVMLLEDLAAGGCHFPSAGDARMLDYARSLVDGLARLHAHYWDTPRWQDELSWVEPAMRHEWGRLLVQAGLEQFGDESPPHFAALAELYLADVQAFNDVLDAGPHTLAHGDSHLGNLFVDGEEVGWLDWACFCHAPGMRDVAYFLTNSLAPEFRRRHERELLDRYRVALATAGGPERAGDEIWREFRRFAGHSWVAAVATAAAGSRMQSVEVGQRAMQRMNEAVADLRTLELFREEI